MKIKRMSIIIIKYSRISLCKTTLSRHCTTHEGCQRNTLNSVLSWATSKIKIPKTGLHGGKAALLPTLPCAK